MSFWPLDVSPAGLPDYRDFGELVERLPALTSAALHVADVFSTLPGWTAPDPTAALVRLSAALSDPKEARLALAAAAYASADRSDDGASDAVPFRYLRAVATVCGALAFGDGTGAHDGAPQDVRDAFRKADAILADVERALYTDRLDCLSGAFDEPDTF